jgi:gliding motility-associated-like protein
MKGKLRLLSLLILYLLSLQGVSAQTPFCDNPNKGAFVLADEDVCVGKTLQLRNQKHGGESIEYVFKFDKNQTDFPATNQRTFDSSFVYTEAGPYTILQWGSQGTGFVLCKDIVVRETAAPNAEFTTCRDGRVRLTILDDAIYRAYDEIEVIWSNGVKKIVKKRDALILDEVIPTNPSATIRGLYNGNNCDAQIKSKVMSGLTNPRSLASIKIKRVQMKDNGTAIITYDAMEGIKTEVLKAEGNGVFEKTGKISDETGGEKEVTITGLDPNKVYHFRLVSIDICDNPTESQVVSSLVLKKGTLVIDESNNLVWDAYPDPVNLLQYQLLREEGPTFIEKESVYNGSDRTDHLDSQLKCGTSYRYTLIASLNGSVKSYSAPITLEPTFTAPGVIRLAEVSVESDNQISTVVSLTGVDGLTTLSNLIVERADAGSNSFQKISPDNNTILSYTDSGVNTAQTSYCYRFSWENTCKQASPPSDVICSVLLTNNVQDMSWTTQSPFTGQVESYDLIRMDESGNIEEETSKQLDHKQAVDLDKDGNSTFKVRAKSGGMVSYSNVIAISGNLIVWAPDIFTPNGDGYNDIFLVKSYFADEFRLLIYNRWGEVVFKSDNTIDGWNGSVDGKPSAPGYYTYKIEGNNIKSGSFSKSGSFLLVR